MRLHAVDVQPVQSGGDGGPHRQEAREELARIGPLGIGLDDVVAQVREHRGCGAHCGGALRCDLDAQGVVRGDPDAQAPRVDGDLVLEPTRVGRRHVPRAAVQLGEHVQRRGGVGHGARHDTRGRRGRHRLDPVGDAVATGLEPDQAVARGRDADRSAAVGGVRDRRHARRDRGARTARGAAGCVVRVPRVAGDAEPLRLGHGDGAELGRRRLAHEHEAGRAQARHRRVVDQLGVLGHGARPVRRRPSLDAVQVLDRDRHAGEGRQLVGRGRRHQLGRRRSIGPGPLVVAQGEGVERRVQPVDPVQVQVERLGGADPPFTDRGGQFERGVEASHGRRGYRRAAARRGESTPPRAGLRARLPTR